MGIFSKGPKVEPCGMCDSLVPADERFSHMSSHVVQISPSSPTWLPEGLRVQAPGEFTFLCERCNSYPDNKWPSTGGAESGMEMHLAVVHGTGRMKGSAAAFRSAINFGMVPVA